ncbi:hypothetical protein FNYG_13901 [Fusarium nygamai]|uniref:Uncharacterized protein n=1 Tax=Gibberella nygamai TaxID=42673 RepID=A0A2K0UUG8_GIBNY|nr:hypothetical protein FNYG_13901 [Fusarium nygamai]
MKLLGKAEKANWLKSHLWSFYNDIQSFSKRMPLIKLKYIETCLRQDDGLMDALEGYKNLGRFFFEHGDTGAADLVSSDAETRIFSHLSSDDPWTFKLASDVYFYSGRFSQCITLLGRAYQLSSESYSDAGYNFEVEMFYASTYTSGLEAFEEDLEKADMRFTFLEKGCEHLSKALRARNMIECDEHTGSEEDQSEGEHDAKKRRKERIADLETRLEDLNGGPILTEVISRTEAVVLGVGVV